MGMDIMSVCVWVGFAEVVVVVRLIVGRSDCSRWTTQLSLGYLQSCILEGLAGIGGGRYSPYAEEKKRTSKVERVGPANGRSIGNEGVESDRRG